MSFQNVPQAWSNLRDHLQKLAIGINALGDGRSNAVGTVTLRASETTTTISDDRIGPDSVLSFMPTTSTAAAAMDVLYISARGKGTATITHDSDAASDRTYSYCIQG